LLGESVVETEGHLELSESRNSHGTPGLPLSRDTISTKGLK
jgi:hypothetical protein